MKNIIHLLCVALVAGAVVAGTEIYNPVIYGPVSIGQWGAVSNFAGVAATNGTYTNAVTYHYRLTATNTLGRLPYTASNSVAINGATTRSAHLTWTYTPRISAYVLERGTTGTWDHFVRLGASLTNAWDDGSSLVWTHGNYSATNECTLSDFPTGGVPVVGIMAGTFYDGAQGDGVSNKVAGLTTDVAVLQTNTATKAQGALADTALQVETDPVWTGWLSTNGTPLTAADVAPIGLLASNALTSADVAPIGLLASNALDQADGAALGLVASNALTAADVAPIGLLASNALTQTDGAALGLVASNALTAADVAPIGLLASNALTSAGVAPIGLLASNALTQADGAALGLLGTNALPTAGGTMTGPLTNDHGYYGDGSGLTNLANLASDPSGWSGYAATQQVVWYEGADTWRAGYDTNSTHWVISCNGTNIQEWSRTSNYDIVHTIIKGHLTVNQSIDVGGGIEADAGIYVPSITLNDVYRDTWPIEYDDSELSNAIWGIGVVVSNLQGANLSELSNNVFSVATEITNAATAASNYTDSVVGNLGLMVTNATTELTNAATAATNYTDGVVAGLGLVVTNLSEISLPRDWTNAPAVNNLTITAGAAPGAVWVATNANGSGELRQLAKMRLAPFGSALISGVNATNKWNPTATYSVGGLTGTVEGVKIHRDGSYLVGLNWAANYCTNPAQVGRAAITLNDAVIALTEYSPRIANNAIQSAQTLITAASAGDIIGAAYRLTGESSGQTNMVSFGGQLSVVEMP